MIKVKELIKELQKLDTENTINVACDEEWNTIFTDYRIEQDGKYGSYVIFGLSGSEEESYEDVANEKYDHNIEPVCGNCSREIDEDGIISETKNRCSRCKDL